MKIRTIALGSLTLLLLAAPAAAKQRSGHLDRSFGDDGTIVLTPRLLGPPTRGLSSQIRHEGATTYETNFHGPSSEGIPTKVMPRRDGGFLIAHGDRLFGYHRDGKLDRSFGAAGVVVVPSPPGEDLLPRGVATDPSGRILVAAEAMKTGAVPDLTPPEFREHFYEYGALPTHAVVMRLLPDGELDPTFGAGGFVQSTFGFAPPTYRDASYATPVVNALSVSSTRDGRLVLSGSYVVEAFPCYPFLSLHFVTRSFVATLSTDGAVESVSSDPNVSRTQFGELTPTSTGALLFTGYQGAECIRGDGPGPNDILTALLSPAGNLMSGTFAGTATFETSPSEGVPQAAADRRGRTVLVGTRSDGGEPEPGAGAIRIRRNGTFDSGFGNHGTSVLRPRETAYRSVAVDRRNRPILGGDLQFETQAGASRGGFTLTRLTARGKIDHGFGKRGVVRIRIPVAEAGRATSILVDADASILIAGELSRSDEKERIGVARYTPGG